MSSLADLPELVGFFSYSREDDEGSHGALSALREYIQHELRAQLGRSFKNFRLWQDKEAIPSGTLWESEIKNAVAQSVFFIPIITPTVVASTFCKFELETFLAREAALRRIGSFAANRFGLYDMVGNVWEWTEDCFFGQGYDGAPIDGSAWTTGNCGVRVSTRVVRGGSWYNSPVRLRSAARFKFTTDGRNNYLGFRVGRTLIAP
jgi:hypothetical protein